MGVHDNKLIISNAIMGTTTSHRGLVRMSIDTLAVEESISMDTLVTDDNTIFSDGYIYLNGEAPAYAYYTNSWDINPGITFSPKAKLVKIKYKALQSWCEQNGYICEIRDMIIDLEKIKQHYYKSNIVFEKRYLELFKKYLN
jgi:hypothetical protein